MEGLNRFYLRGEEVDFSISPIEDCEGDSMPIAFAGFDSALVAIDSTIEKLFLSEDLINFKIFNDSVVGTRAFGVNGFCFEEGQIESESRGDFAWFVFENESTRDSLIQVHGNASITIFRQ